MSGCPCGGGVHAPDSHLWTAKQVGLATHRPARSVLEDRRLPSCPLHSLGHGRGSRWLVFTWDEVRAFMRWTTSEDGRLARAGGAA